MKVLVTGASEGIGRCFAKRLMEENYAVTAVARNENRLQELMAEMDGVPGSRSHSYLVADLTKNEGIEKVSAHLQREKYDILINNAGLATYGIFREMEASKIHEMMALNCDGLIKLSRIFLATAKKGDALINVSSTASFLPMPITSIYAGSKAFVTSFSESLWFEERNRGVYVMALCPGMTHSKFHSRAGGKEGQVPSWLSQTPAQVVGIALKQLRRRKKPVVVCGPQKYFIFLCRFIPRKWVIFFTGKILEWGLK